MKIKNIEVEDYIEDFDGSVEGCNLIKNLDGGYGVYENENGKFLIEDYNGENEFIYKVI
jgi:hypothetical protein